MSGAANVLNGKNLDSSERMAVSGSSGVYADPAGELMGSNARLAKLELSHSLPEIDGLQHSASLFTTYGHAESAQAISATDKGRDINDVGLGWKGNYQSVMFNAALAYRIEDTQPVSEKVDRIRLLVQSGYLF